MGSLKSLVNMTHPLDPMANTYAIPSPEVSRKDFVIGGILCAIYGLEELPPQGRNVSCLYLLHPRGNTMAGMGGIATSAVVDWNENLQQGNVATSRQSTGLISVCFDQRNHGTREVDKLRNEAWRQGNPNHAQDMFSIFNGTARDVSQIMDMIHSYVFPKGDRTIVNNLVLGVSLGAHAAWHCILHEPRIKAAVVVIGCPDYISLMSDRARLSKLTSWKTGDTPGSQFLGSEHFPQNLVDMTNIWDPAGLLFGQMKDAASNTPIRLGPIRDPTDKEKKDLIPIMTRCLAGKSILNIAGGSDKLVPYSRGEPFLTWLKRAIAPGGWFAEGKVTLEDVIFEGAGHEVTPAMMKEAIRFISETLAAGERTPKTGFSMSKI